jgi:uncharacterized protein with HEPN domain
MRPAHFRLSDIIDMSGKLRAELEGVSLGELENDWKRQLLVERGLEIISEASRNIDPGIKERHRTIPWRNIADIGNVLRHAYHKIEPSLTWQIVKDHLPDLQRV